MTKIIKLENGSEITVGEELKDKLSSIEVLSVDSPIRRYCCIKIGEGALNQKGYSKAITTAVKTASVMGNSMGSVMAALIIGSPETIIVDVGIDDSMISVRQMQAGRHLAMSVTGGLIQEQVDFSVAWKKEYNGQDKEDEELACSKTTETPDQTL